MRMTVAAVLLPLLRSARMYVILTIVVRQGSKHTVLSHLVIVVVKQSVLNVFQHRDAGQRAFAHRLAGGHVAHPSFLHGYVSAVGNAVLKLYRLSHQDVLFFREAACDGHILLNPHGQEI